MFFFHFGFKIGCDPGAGSSLCFFLSELDPMKKIAGPHPNPRLNLQLVCLMVKHAQTIHINNLTANLNYHVLAADSPSPVVSAYHVTYHF